ncbi:MAG: peptide-methionine (R)-S-oxide reductase MsrB [Candidatus Sericytochromatia bacterium]|nr:peptide-methionine (R)-S-oxide reductase MsrB [Candidatus Sericytochromatia bacterium]
MTDDWKTKSDAYWREHLTPQQYHVLREKGTDRPFSAPDDHGTVKGVYRCSGCGLELFSSQTKFDSGSGWPSFGAPIAPDHVTEHVDNSSFMTRTELLCQRCGGHLGHVFNDGPAPTGQRYCINASSLDLDSKEAP